MNADDHGEQWAADENLRGSLTNGLINFGWQIKEDSSWLAEMDHNKSSLIQHPSLHTHGFPFIQ